MISALKVLGYGESGSGKTLFGSTFPRPSYYFDTDDGMLSLKGLEDIEYDTYEDIDLSNPKGAVAVEAKLKELHKECPYKAVVFDSITTLADLAMNRILHLNGRASGVPQQQDWLQQMTWLKNLILRGKALPCHVYFTAHEQIIQDEATMQVKCLPLITGKLAGKLPLYFDEVYHMETTIKDKETVYRLLTKNNGKYLAKSRLNSKFNYFDTYEPQDFKLLEAKIKQKGV